MSSNEQRYRNVDIQLNHIFHIVSLGMLGLLNHYREENRNVKIALLTEITFVFGSCSSRLSRLSLFITAGLLPKLAVT